MQKHNPFNEFYPVLKTENNILKTIAYFDMFRYPVTATEIRLFSGNTTTAEEIETVLASLTLSKQLFKLDEFYALVPDRSLIERRRKGNERAACLLDIAYRVGRLLYKFPFVNGVGVSGSLSKNYADENADIDFFIITQPNRLWIARTLLHCLKKLSFLMGKQHWYCMNYFIDEDALVIAEKNIFTATEVVTLKPVCGETAIPLFFKANQWVKDYFPNHSMPSIVHDSAKPWYKKWTEKILNNRLGNWLDDYAMRVTGKRWLQKEIRHKLNSKGEPIGLAVGKHFARPNPTHLQKKVLDMYEGRLLAVEQKWGISFDDAAHFLRKEII
jgi:hypothetical protein